MANHTSMGAREAITRLYEQGWKKRRIARELSLDRKTVRRYIREVEAAKSPISPAGTEDAKGTISPAGKSGRPSLCKPHHIAIERWVDDGLCAQRIYQDLKAEYGFQGAYDSVKRYVRREFQEVASRVWRMESLPGEEAQVDFGLGAPIIENGHKRRAHVFRIVLSFSRKAYSEAVLRQDTESFIRCLENAFRHFCGVPKSLILDNLKAAVNQADWYDPEINPKILEFGRHYGIAIIPTRPYSPEHKGKVENSVHYVKRNALKAKEFGSLYEENRYLLEWETNVADCRVHGTTRQQVSKLFETEKPALSTLPDSLFPCFQEGKRRVHRDSYIEVAKAYYEVPAEYIGKDVWARWDGHLVRIFNLKMEAMGVLARKAPGDFSTVLGSRGRCQSVEHSISHWQDKAMKLGEHCGLWADKVLDVRGPWAIRVLQGLVALTRNYSVAEIQEGCRLALTHGHYHLRQLRALIRQPAEQKQFDFLSVHPLIRDINEYGAITQNNKEVMEA